MDKSKAVEVLRRQINKAEELQRTQRFLPEFKKWKRDTEVAIEKIFTNNTRHLNDFQTVSYILRISTNNTHDSEHQRAYVAGLQNAISIMHSFIDEINEYGLSDDCINNAHPLIIIENIFRKFHGFARQLRSRHEGRATLDINDEYDVQDALHSLLTFNFEDIRTEEWTPSYAGSSSRMDILLKQEKIVIETKKTSKRLGAKQLGEELIVDIAKYQTHPDCQLLLCFVYDPEGKVSNPRGIENDLSRKHDGIEVKVIIAP